MAYVRAIIALMAVAIPVFANPMPETLGRIVVARQDAGSCRNQSCEVAAVAGSTGATVYNFPSYPTGDTQGGDCCIIQYFPAAKAAIYAERPGLSTYCSLTGGDAPKDSNPPGVSTISVAGLAAATATPTATATPLFGGLFGRDTTPTCKPNILIFAKGTLEPGDVGITVGSSLQSALDSNHWSVIGVNYDNSLDGDYCLGLPGGVAARQSLESAVAQCPNSVIAMGGYSQGAMVVRNAIARASSAAVAKVKNVVTFGDPFCGAPIGQYSGPVHVFCANGDGVCDGQLNIGLAHLSYGGDISAAAAILTASQA